MIALHKSGLDVFSALCYFFAMILPALQGSAGDICGALLDGKNDTVLRFAVIILHSHRPLAVHRWQDSLCFARIAAVIPGT